MFLPDIIINTNTYSLITQRQTSSVRGDALRPLGEPKLVTVSHETVKSGKVSTAVFIDDTKTVSVVGATVPTTDTIRAMLKLQYNPLIPRATLEADINSAIADLIAFLSVAENINKLLNKES